MEYDWPSCMNIKERGNYLYKSGKMADCAFLVGEASNHRLISAHKIILASASPVFEGMLYGPFQQITDPIPISDVDPDAFQAMIQFIYSEKVNITSFDKACDLYRVSDIYIMPKLVEHCVAFILKNLSPGNACCAYEMGKLYDNAEIIEQSSTIIVQKTREVLLAPSFLNIQFDTLIMILDQNKLTIDSELDIVDGVLKYAYKHDLFSQNNDKLELSALKQPQKQENTEYLQQEAAGTSVDVKEIEMEPNAHGPKSDAPEKSSGVNMEPEMKDEPLLHLATKKIRFLSLTPHQFSKGAARSKLLKPSEALTLMLKVSNPCNNDPMPEGFCSSRLSRNAVHRTCSNGHEFESDVEYYFCAQCRKYTTG